MEIKKGDIFMINFNPARGSEQAGIRPAVIIQNDIGNKFGSMVIVSAITSMDKKLPFFVNIKKSKLNGLSNNSSVNTSQVLTLDKQRLVKKIGELNKIENILLDKALKISLGLN